MKEVQKQEKQKLNKKHLLWGIAPLVVAPAAVAGVIAIKQNGENESSEKVTRSLLSKNEIDQVVSEEAKKVYDEHKGVQGYVTIDEIENAAKSAVDEVRPATKGWLRKFIRKELLALMDEIQVRMEKTFKKALIDHDASTFEQLWSKYEAKWNEANNIEFVDLNKEASQKSENQKLKILSEADKGFKWSKDKVVGSLHLTQLVVELENWIRKVENQNVAIRKANMSDEFQLEYKKYLDSYEEAKNIKEVKLAKGAVAEDQNYLWYDFANEKTEDVDFPNIQQIKESTAAIERWKSYATKYNDYINQCNEKLVYALRR